MMMVLVLHTRYDGISAVYDGGMDASHFFRFLFEAMSIVGVNLFVFISGYFGIRLRKSSVGNLLFQVYYFAAIAFVGLWLVSGSLPTETRDYLKLFFPLSHNVWFVPCYFILMLLSPVLNAFIERQTARSLAIYTGALYLIAYVWANVWGSVSGFDGYGWGFFIILYLTGAAVRKWSDDHRMKKSLAIAGYAVCTMLIVGAAWLQNYFPVGRSLLWAYDCPLVYLSSICLFLFFVNLEIAPNKTVNTIAASSFAVLLFHMSACSRYPRVCGYLFERYSGPVVILLTAFAVVAYYAAALLLDQPRKYLFNRVIAKYLK